MKPTPKPGTIDYLHQQEANVRVMIAAFQQMQGTPDDRVAAILQCAALMQMRLKYDPTQLRLWFGDVCRDMPDQAQVLEYWEKLGGK